MRPYGLRVHANAIVLERRGRGPAGRALSLVPITAPARGRREARAEVELGRDTTSWAEARLEASDQFYYWLEGAETWDAREARAAWRDRVPLVVTPLQLELARALNRRAA